MNTQSEISRPHSHLINHQSMNSPWLDSYQKGLRSCADAARRVLLINPRKRPKAEELLGKGILPREVLMVWCKPADIEKNIRKALMNSEFSLIVSEELDLLLNTVKLRTEN